MRVAIFFDGKNFYKALDYYNPTIEIDYDKFAHWVTQAAAGPGGIFVGAYYYTGHTAEGSFTSGVKFTDFLRGLEMRRGYFVRREPRVLRTNTCKRCGHISRYRTEKRVDSRLVADLIHYAAVNAFDVAVLASGDQDFVPAVEAVNSLGKQVLVGVWPGHGLSRDLRVCCFAQINFADGEVVFSTGRRRGHLVPVSTPSAAPVLGTEIPASSNYEKAASELSALSAVEEIVLLELGKAAGILPHVSRWYFENKWICHGLPRDVTERNALIQKLVSNGHIEQYEVTDSKGRPTAAVRKRLISS